MNTSQYISLIIVSDLGEGWRMRGQWKLFKHLRSFPFISITVLPRNLESMQFRQMFPYLCGVACEENRILLWNALLCVLCVSCRLWKSTDLSVNFSEWGEARLGPDNLLYAAETALRVQVICRYKIKLLLFCLCPHHRKLVQ